MCIGMHSSASPEKIPLVPKSTDRSRINGLGLPKSLPPAPLRARIVDQVFALPPPPLFLFGSSVSRLRTASLSLLCPQWFIFLPLLINAFLRFSGNVLLIALLVLLLYDIFYPLGPPIIENSTLRDSILELFPP